LTRLDHETADRLTKLLGLLSSDHDGERAAAGRKADQFVRSLGLSWSDIVFPSDAIADRDWHAMAAYCNRHSDQLTDKERDFIATMLEWRRRPSEKQEKWLCDIYARLVSEGGQ
jgi:hypothetical protein